MSRFALLMTLLLISSGKAQSLLFGDITPKPTLTASLSQSIDEYYLVVQLLKSTLAEGVNQLAKSELNRECGEEGEYIFWGSGGPELRDIPGALTAQLTQAGYPYTELTTTDTEENMTLSFSVETSTTPIVASFAVGRALFYQDMSDRALADENDTTKHLGFMLWCSTK